MKIKCCEDKDNKLIIDNKDFFDTYHSENNSKYFDIEYDNLIVIPVIIHICVTKSKSSIDILKYCKHTIDTLNSGFSGKIKNKYKSDSSDKYNVEYFSKICGSEKNGKIIYDYINYKFDTKIRFYLETIEYHNKNFTTDFTNPNTEALIDNFYKEGFVIKEEYKQKLNIIVINFTCSTLGISTFPWMRYVLNKNIEEMFVFLDYKCVHPDLSNTKYNNCRTLIHEVGHILGLRHSFSNNHDTLLTYKILLGETFSEKIFNSQNLDKDKFQLYPDIVGQNEPTIKNPIEKNKFELSNEIPINFACFMDYSPDEVLTHFTKSQIIIMRTIINIYKNYLIVNSSIYLEKFNNQEYFYLNMAKGYLIKQNSKKTKIKISPLINKYFRYKIVYKDLIDYKIKSKPKLFDI